MTLKLWQVFLLYYESFSDTLIHKKVQGLKYHYDIMCWCLVGMILFWYWLTYHVSLWVDANQSQGVGREGRRERRIEACFLSPTTKCHLGSFWSTWFLVPSAFWQDLSFIMVGCPSTYLKFCWCSSWNHHHNFVPCLINMENGTCHPTRVSYN